MWLHRRRQEHGLASYNVSSVSSTASSNNSSAEDPVIESPLITLIAHFLPLAGVFIQSVWVGVSQPENKVLIYLIKYLIENDIDI